MEVYPIKYKVLWRFGRVFLSVFLIQVGAGLTNVEDFEAGKALLIAAASGGLVALGKAIREWFKENEELLYQYLVRKLPF